MRQRFETARFGREIVEQFKMDYESRHRYILWWWIWRRYQGDLRWSGKVWWKFWQWGRLLGRRCFFLSDEVDEKATVLTEGQNTRRALNGRVYFCIELQILRMTRWGKETPRELKWSFQRWDCWKQICIAAIEEPFLNKRISSSKMNGWKKLLPIKIVVVWSFSQGFTVSLITSKWNKIDDVLLNIPLEFLRTESRCCFRFIQKMIVRPRVGLCNEEILLLSQSISQQRFERGNSRNVSNY